MLNVFFWWLCHQTAVILIRIRICRATWTLQKRKCPMFDSTNLSKEHPWQQLHESKIPMKQYSSPDEVVKSWYPLLLASISVYVTIFSTRAWSRISLKAEKTESSLSFAWRVGPGAISKIFCVCLGLCWPCWEIGHHWEPSLPERMTWAPAPVLKVLASGSSSLLSFSSSKSLLLSACSSMIISSSLTCIWSSDSVSPPESSSWSCCSLCTAYSDVIRRALLPSIAKWPRAVARSMYIHCRLPWHEISSLDPHEVPFLRFWHKAFQLHM